MANDKNCKETNTPLSDNTPLECPTFHLDKCVIVPEGSAFLLTNDNDDLREFHVRLIEKLVAQQQRILTLEATNPQIVDYELDLNGTVLSILINNEVKDTVDLQSLTTGGLIEAKEQFLGTQGQTTITLSNTPSTAVPNQVIIDGFYLTEGPSSDYIITGNQLILATPLNQDDSVQVLYKY